MLQSWSQRATLNFQRFKVALNHLKFKVDLNPTYRNFLNFAKSCVSSCLNKYKRNSTVPFLNYKPLKLDLRVFLAGHSVTMVTCCVTKITTMCSTMVWQYFDTMIVASSNRVVMKTHQNLSAGNCCVRSKNC